MNQPKEIPSNSKDSFRNSIENEKNQIKTHKSEKYYNKANIHKKLISKKFKYYKENNIF